MTVSPVDVARLEALEAQATSGPWCADGDSVLAGDDGTRLAAFNASPDDQLWPSDITAVAEGGVNEADAEFIAATRNAAPSLLAAYRAVERVRALHYPRSDGPSSLVDWSYCSCGAMESFIAGDGHTSIGPARYPCPTIRALAGAR